MVVATQMLESMIVSPTPTRAEVSDVANAIYEGADAIMLSAESAAGAFPVEAVAMMDRIGRSVEADPVYSARIHFTETPAEATTADALSESAAQIVEIIKARAMACYTASGSTARRIARERAQVPTLCDDRKHEGRAAAGAAVGRPCGPHPRRQQFRGNGRQGASGWCCATIWPGPATGC